MKTSECQTIDGRNQNQGTGSFEFLLKNGIRQIQLTQGKFALVDSEDFDKLTKHKWHFHQTGYAMRSTKSGGVKRLIRMHREVVTVSDKLCVDHINGNTLDNRKSNLRLSTRKQNQHNRGRNRNNSSGFKGVSAMRDKWRARITIGWKEIHLGTFATKEEAFDAYVKAAKKYHKSFANIGI